MLGLLGVLVLLPAGSPAAPRPAATLPDDLSAAQLHLATGSQQQQQQPTATGTASQLFRLNGSAAPHHVFTSGATEANNLGLKGVVQAEAYAKRPRHVVTSVTEHHAVLDPLRTLEEHGLRVTRLAVDAGGHVDLGELEKHLQEGVLLVALMHANNETGVLHPVDEIGGLCRAHEALFFTDATQSVGKEPLDWCHVTNATYYDFWQPSATANWLPNATASEMLARAIGGARWSNATKRRWGSRATASRVASGLFSLSPI